MVVTTLGSSTEDEGAFRVIFEGSPDPGVHTSAAAETAFLMGLLAVVAAPFTLLLGVSVGCAVLGALFSVAGLAATSRTNVAGGVLAPLGFTLAFAAVLLIGLRYAGLDTAFGDALVPSLHGWLETLNGYLPSP